MKLSSATQGKWGARPTTHDEQLIVRHQGVGNALDFIATQHVDGIKAGCSADVLKAFIACLEQVFGKDELEITLENVDCCGLTHTITDAGYEVDRISYISNG